MLKTKLCFFDDYWVDFRTGTVRRWYEPVYQGHYRDPYFEGTGFGRIEWIPGLGKYRMFYNVWPDMGNDCIRYLCVAESLDGIHFTPEELFDRPEKSMRHVISDGSDGVMIMDPTYDGAEPDPEKRFKSAAFYFPKDSVETGYVKLLSGSSPDCINWSFDMENPAHPSTSDADNTILYNPYTEEYMLFFRAAYVDRRICYKTSKDLKNWSESVCCIHPGAYYNNEAFEMQLYGIVPYYADGIFYGMVQNFYTYLTDTDFSKMWGFIESELYYSYDGKNYMPTSGRPVTQRTNAPDFGSTQLYMGAPTATADGRDYLIPAIGSRVIHGPQSSNQEYCENLNDEGGAFATCLFKIRKDGFCGIEGIGTGSRLITKCVQLLEDDLTFNINASCGFVRYGIMNKAGEFVEGFSFDDCVAFRGNEVEHKPVWKGHSLSELLGKQIRVAVELNGAVLHSLSMTARPYIRKPQKSFAQPDQLLGQ